MRSVFSLYTPVWEKGYFYESKHPTTDRYEVTAQMPEKPPRGESVEKRYMSVLIGNYLS